MDSASANVISRSVKRDLISLNLFGGAVLMVIATTFGLMIWQQWPVSGLWVIGLFIGVEMIFNGITTMFLATELHREKIHKGATRQTPAMAGHHVG